MANDVEGALSGVFLLHETYEMDLKKLSRGLVEVPGSDGKREVAGEIAMTDKDLGRESEPCLFRFKQFNINLCLQRISKSPHLNRPVQEIVSKLAFNRGFYNRACEWAETALWRAEEDGAPTARLLD